MSKDNAINSCANLLISISSSSDQEETRVWNIIFRICEKKGIEKAEIFYRLMKYGIENDSNFKAVASPFRCKELGGE